MTAAFMSDENKGDDFLHSTTPKCALFKIVVTFLLYVVTLLTNNKLIHFMDI